MSTVATDRAYVERQRHVLERMTRYSASQAQAEAAVDQELELEAVRAREKEAKIQEDRRAFEAMCRCQVCGEQRGLGVRDGFCDPCRLVVQAVRAERALGDQVDGHSRRELAEAFLERVDH